MNKLDSKLTCWGHVDHVNCAQRNTVSLSIMRFRPGVPEQHWHGLLVFSILGRGPNIISFLYIKIEIFIWKSIGSYDSLAL